MAEDGVRAVAVATAGVAFASPTATDLVVRRPSSVSQQPRQSRSSTQFVKLNVGGSLFTTTMSTIEKQGSHMLSAMLSGRMESTADGDGFLQIDRDGRLFHYILNFLRDGTVPLPDSEADRRMLLTEARFYCLDGLARMIESHNQPSSNLDSLRCTIPVVVSDHEERLVISNSREGSPVVVFAYNRGNNKFSYTAPSDDHLLKNIELFDKLSTKFAGRILYVRDPSGRDGNICTWFMYGHGQLVAEVCCTSMVYAADKKQIKIEFPEARLFEENMNLLLYEPGVRSQPERFLHRLSSPRSIPTSPVATDI